jgi:hypothetical protein
LILLLAGADPFWFFFGNLLLLMGITLCVVLIAQRYGMEPFQATLAGIFFLLSGPIIENAYTLTKGELQQTLWLLAGSIVAVS